MIKRQVSSSREGKKRGFLRQDFLGKKKELADPFFLYFSEGGGKKKKEREERMFSPVTICLKKKKTTFPIPSLLRFGKKKKKKRWSKPGQRLGRGTTSTKREDITIFDPCQTKIRKAAVLSQKGRGSCRGLRVMVKKKSWWLILFGGRGKRGLIYKGQTKRTRDLLLPLKKGGGGDLRNHCIKEEKEGVSRLS